MKINKLNFCLNPPIGVVSMCCAYLFSHGHHFSIRVISTRLASWCLISLIKFLIEHGFKAEKKLPKQHCQNITWHSSMVLVLVHFICLFYEAVNQIRGFNRD